MTSPNDRTRAGRPWSAIVVAVLGLAIVAFGIVGRFVATPTSGPPPLATGSDGLAHASESAAPDPERTAGPLPSIETIGEDVIDMAHEPEAGDGNVYVPIGVLEGVGVYTFALACSGPGDLAIVVPDGTPADASLTIPCAGALVTHDLEVVAPELDLSAVSRTTTSWRVVVTRPEVAEQTPETPPTPTPAPVEPTLPCGSTAPLTAPPSISLTVRGRSVAGAVASASWTGMQADGAVDPAMLPVISLDQTDPADIRIAGGACALNWEIQAQPLGEPDPAPGPVVTLGSHMTASAESAATLLNHFPIDGLAPGEWVIRASMTFDQGNEVVWWHVRTETVLFGRAMLSAGSTSVAGLEDGCPTWSIGGEAGGDTCGPIAWPVDRVKALRVVGDSPITFSIPGWAAEGTASVASAESARAALQKGDAPRARQVPFDGQVLDVPYGEVALYITVTASRPDAEFSTAYLFHVIHVRP